MCRSVLTGFFELVQLFFHFCPFRPFRPWPSQYLNHTAMPPLEIACTHSRHVCKLFTPCCFVLTGFIELVQLFFHFRPFWPWPSLYLNHAAICSFAMV